jgi:DNA-binding response OmpR family regulator
VLVVDDDPGCTQGLRWLLNDEGFEVTTAASGVEALARLQADPPDALITDIEMPGGLDGLALMRLVRKQFPRMVVIVMSSSHHQVASVLGHGALAYVSKPIDFDELLSSLDAGLQLRDDVWVGCS